MVNKNYPSSNDLSIEVVLQCVNCGSKTLREKSRMICVDCSSSFEKTAMGVWDFRKLNEREPKIFQEDEFLRWLKVFREKESKDWIIYSNSFFRWISQAGHRILGRQINKGHTADKLILEIGAGTGALLEHVRLARFVAVDTSIESLETLKTKWPNALCICASANSLPFEDGTFDHIVSLHTLEHLYFLSEALEEAKRVSKQDGGFHYVIPTEGGLGFYLGRKIVTGPHLKKKYNLDVDYVMDREHINDAPRVLKFLRMHFEKVEINYWPFRLLKILSPNVMIYGKCSGHRRSGGNGNDLD